MKRFLPLAFFAALCLLLAFGMTSKKETPPTSRLIGKPFPTLTLEGKEVSALLAGKVTLVNIFASWCAPCAIEQPVLLSLAAKNALPILGIAWKTKPEDAQKFLTTRGNPYATYLLDENGDSTIPLALTGVPETFIVDKNGIIRYDTTQPITSETLTQEILPLVERLQKE